MSLEQTYPPPASVTQPRQLNRWLDKRFQNGPLSRTHGYFTLPLFSIATTWLGFSNIVGAYNYTASKNFSLRPDVLVIPDNPNYTLCISWVDEDNNVFRYSLWRADGDVFNFGLEPYTNQLIRHNFRLEVWDTDSTPAIQASNLTIYSTILGDQDYMHGADFSIAAASVLCEGQAYGESATTEPATTDRLFWWTASAGVTPSVNLNLITDWVDRDGAYNLEPVGIGPTYHAVAQGNFTPKSLEFVSFSDLAITETFLSIKHLFFTFKTIGGVGKVLEFTYPGLTAILEQPEANTKLKLTLGLSDVTTDNVLGTNPAIVEIIVGSIGSVDTINVYNALTRAIIQTTKSMTVYPLLAMNSMELGDTVAGGGFLMSDFIGYSDVLASADRNTTLEYLFNLFDDASAIPLVPSACAQPTLN